MWRLPPSDNGKSSRVRDLRATRLPPKKLSILMTDTNNSQEERQDEAAPISDSSVASGSQRRTSDTAPRRPAPRQTSSSGARQLLFIDAGTDRNTASEAVRVHVMREAHRTRRERQGAQSRSRVQTSSHGEMVIFDASQTIAPVERSAIASTEPIATIPTVVENLPPQPTQVLDWPSIIRTGMSQLSLQSMQDLRRLAEGYLRSLRMVQPDVLQLCQGDFLAMNAYLALAALQLAIGEQEPANVASVQFEARALELLRLRIGSSTQMHSDGTIVAVLLLSKLETNKNNAESALFHRNALQRLIHDRGGMQVLQEQNAELHKVLLEDDFDEPDG